MMMNCLSVERVGHRWQWDDDDNNVNDNGSKNEDEPEIEPGGHTKPSSNKTLSSCHLERKEAFRFFYFDKMVDRSDN